MGRNHVACFGYYVQIFFGGFTCSGLFSMASCMLPLSRSNLTSINPNPFQFFRAAPSYTKSRFDFGGKNLNFKHVHSTSKSFKCLNAMKTSNMSNSFAQCDEYSNILTQKLNDSIAETVVFFIKRFVLYPLTLSFCIQTFLCPIPAIADDNFTRREARPDITMEIPGLLDFLSTPSPEPEQVHVSLAGPNRMKVSWVTEDTESPSLVEFGTSSGVYDRQATGESLSYSYLMYQSGLIHHVVLGMDEPLKDDTMYYYRCGGEGEEFSFKTTPPVGPDTPITLAIIGDLGQTGWSISTLDHMAESPHDMVLLAGDLSYADRFQPRWDSWGRLIEPLASSRPWMVTGGNHDIERIPGLESPFQAYNARWSMPHKESLSPSNLYYSFDAGSVHFVVLASYTNYLPASQQYLWLQNDLSGVDRSRTPWVIAMLHEPWYNSNAAHQGDGMEMMESMEGLLYQHKVDMLFSGHVHAYERSARVYKESVNPCGTMHVTIGDGGNREGLASRYLQPVPAWSLKREASFGHGLLEIMDSNSARWTWHRNQDDIDVVADEVVIQSLHASNAPSCSVADLAAVSSQP